jgi:hypothetical protein
LGGCGKGFNGGIGFVDMRIGRGIKGLYGGIGFVDITIGQGIKGLYGRIGFVDIKIARGIRGIGACGFVVALLYFSLAWLEPCLC